MKPAVKYQPEGSKLYFSVKQEARFFVADFFAEDRSFIQDWAVPKHSTSLEEFVESCKTMTFFIENPRIDGRSTLMSMRSKRRNPARKSR